MWEDIGLPDSPVVKNLPADEEDSGSIPIQEDAACLRGTKPGAPQLLRLLT